ncbi:MAG: HAD family hydrolase, partial [archaeon]|nr:HAD family hydrolase [archaeon]
SVDNTSNSKPHEEPFLKAIELSGLAPGECVYVGDSLTKDMMPAKKIGMKTIWLTRESEKNEFVDVSIGSIYEVEEAISKIG